MTNLKNLTKTRTTTAIAGVFILASALLVGSQALLPIAAFAEPSNGIFALRPGGSTPCTPGTQDKNFEISLSGTGYDSTYGSYSVSTDISGTATIKDVCQVGETTMNSIPSSVIGSVVVRDGLRGFLTLHDIVISKGSGSLVTVSATFVDQDGLPGTFYAYLYLNSDLRLSNNDYSVSGTQYIYYNDNSFNGRQSVSGSLAFL